jgi:deoxyribose-phosphate aldolase
MNIASLIDHTLLKPEATEADIERLCQEAKTHQFWSVCVNPFHVRTAATLLHGTGVKTASVVGFPLGANQTRIKAAEAELTLADGAGEIDMVLNIGALKAGNFDHVRGDIAAVAQVSRARGALLKVIFETCLLNEAEKTRACELSVAAGAHFVKTSTGLSSGGATVADVELMSRLVKPHGLQVKASGGIRTLADLQTMVEAGATRIGTSAGIKILQEAAGQKVAPSASGY